MTYHESLGEVVEPYDLDRAGVAIISSQMPSAHDLSLLQVELTEREMAVESRVERYGYLALQPHECATEAPREGGNQ